MTDLKRIRGIRCSLVVGDVLTKLMQEVMKHKNTEPEKLCELAFKSSKFTKLLTPEEMNIVQTLKTDGYTKLDINIMYKIAKFFKTFYVEPTQSWTGRPNADNISIGDDMQRIKRARDFYGHYICPVTTEKEMDEFFGIFVEVGKRVDKFLSNDTNCSYVTRILNYKTCPLDNEKNERILKEDDELKKCVIFQIHLKQGIDLRVVCDEETKQKIKTECTKCDEDDWMRIKMYTEGVKDSEKTTAMINIKKDEINNQSIEIKIDEALHGSVVLHILVKQVILQDDARFLREVETFITLLQQVAHLEYSADTECYLIITAAEESLDTDSSSEEEEDYTKNAGVEMEKENIILNIHVKKEVLDIDEIFKDRLGDFMKVLGDEMNGVEVTDKHEMKAILQFKKDKYELIESDMMKVLRGNLNDEEFTDKHDIKSTSIQFEKDKDELIESDMMKVLGGNLNDEEFTDKHEIKSTSIQFEKENDELIESDMMKVLGGNLNDEEFTDIHEMKSTSIQFEKGSLNDANQPTFCTICEERHIYKQSCDWCIECEQALCTECKQFHAISKASRNHGTIPITDYQALNQSISSICFDCIDHEEKYQMFCQTHGKPLCLQCIEEHSGCNDLIPLSKITKNVKTSEAFREAEECS